MDFTADHYYRAALERMTQAQDLYREGAGNYALSMYTAGLAVECMLRAFMLLLAKESGILILGRDKLKVKGLTDEQLEEHEKTLWASLNDVFFLWRNSYRFASEARLLSHIKRMKLYEGVKGDPVKANALRLLSAAQRFMEKGVLQWR